MAGFGLVFFEKIPIRATHLLRTQKLSGGGPQSKESTEAQSRRPL
jgi:hypothetical protein